LLICCTRSGVNFSCLPRSDSFFDPVCIFFAPKACWRSSLSSASSTWLECFLVVQTLWAEKIQSTTDAGSLSTFGRNEIEVAPISSALPRIACFVILYKTCRVPDQELADDGASGSV